MMPASQAATRYPPRRGRTATTSPATISITPTAYIAWGAVPGTILSIQGARYLSQFTSTWANLSNPNRMGAAVNPNRSNQNAWQAGFSRQASRTPTDDRAVGTGWDV